MKKAIIAVIMLVMISTVASASPIIPTNQWPEWARDDRASNGTEVSIQEQSRTLETGAVKEIFGRAFDNSNRARTSTNIGKMFSDKFSGSTSNQQAGEKQSK